MRRVIEDFGDDFEIGDKIMLTDDALDNYGKQYRNKTFTVTHIAHSTREHPGYDEAMGGEALLDLDELEFSLYSYEVILV